MQELFGLCILCSIFRFEHNLVVELKFKMNDLAYQILDELYFVISFEKLYAKFADSKNELSIQLIEMINASWVNYYTHIEGEINPTMDINIETIEKLYFLASKKGLFAHNSI